MDDHNQLTDVHSPREKFELTDQLAHFEGEGDRHFQFEEGDNPFSFYNDAEHRDHPSSEDDPNEDYAHQQVTDNNHPPHPTLPHIEPADNLATKPPIPLLQPPQQSPPSQQQPPLPQVVKQQQNPLASTHIKLLKESEFDISKLPTPKVESSPVAQRKLQQESQYQQQLTGDMEQLKNSLKSSKQSKKKFKIFDSPKQEPKVNLNKTYAHSKGKQLNQSQLQLQQMRMLVKMAFEKKKANYEMLKEWDRKRAQNMALHGRMIELLQNQIDIRIKSSLQNFQHYQTFFRQKARQEEKYVSSPVINTRYALQDNSLSKNVYINCSVILNSLCDQNASRCKKINDFIHLIRTNILKELTQAHLNSSQKELLRVRQKISTLKASLKKYNQETEEKTVELGNLFKEQSNNITNKCQKDFYRTQLSFLRKAIQQIQVQKKLGEYCLEYYHTAVQEELKRSSVIREAMLTYSRGLNATYNLDTESVEIQQMSKHQELKLIEEYFSLQEMFDPRTIELFKAYTHLKGDITIELFTSYINHFNYEMFDSRVILLKQFAVRFVSGKGKDITQESSYLVITVDNFLHLTFNAGRGVCCKPDITIKICQKGLQVRGGKDEYVDIIKKQERRSSMMSYFWQSKADKVYRVKFAKKDNKEEFMDYITKLMVGNY